MKVDCLDWLGHLSRKSVVFAVVQVNYCQALVLLSFFLMIVFSQQKPKLCWRHC